MKQVVYKFYAFFYQIIIFKIKISKKCDVLLIAFDIIIWYFILLKIYVSIKNACYFFVSTHFAQNKWQISQIFQNIIRFFKIRHHLNFSILKIEKNYFSININPNPTLQNHFYTFSMLNSSNLQKKLYHVKNSHNGATFKIKVWSRPIVANIKIFRTFKRWYLSQILIFCCTFFFYSR